MESYKSVDVREGRCSMCCSTRKEGRTGMRENGTGYDSGPTLVELRGVVKRYGAFQLGPLDLDVPAGSVTALVGPNGAGKTTLLRLVMGLAAPNEGTIRVFGRTPDPNDATTKASIGFVPEEPFLYDELTPAWHGRFAAAWYPTWDWRRYQQLLERFSVPQDKKTKELSKGNRVKAELALALAHDPQLLVLDEPTSGLDPLVRREVLDEVAGLVADGRRAAIFSTHITEDVERIADRVVFLVDGQVRLVADRELLRAHWQELWVDERLLQLTPRSNGTSSSAFDLPEVVRLEPAGAGAIRVVTSNAPATLDRLSAAARAAGLDAGGSAAGVPVIRRRPLRLEEVLDFVARDARDPGSREG